MKHHIHSTSPWEPRIGFSRACRSGSYIAVSGTAAVDADGNTLFPGDAYQQTRFCLQRAIKAVEQAGGCADDIIRTRILLTAREQWHDAARAHGELFAAIRPACTFAIVSGFIDPAWLVEVEMDALVPGADS